VGHNRQFPAEWISEQHLEQLKKEGYDPVATRGPESERLDLALMIRGYTINGAYQLRMEDEIGSIETGKLADLVVLDDNLFEMDRYEILDVKPSAVIMEGELIHGALP
jgi:predicted amidohydrolase YtcJ